MKNIILLLLLLLVPTLQLFAQDTRSDSIAIKIKLAKADVRKFRTTKQIRTARRKRLLLNSSDYFKPTAATVSNPKFLTDSIYVMAYKDAAYNRSIHNSSLVNLHYRPDLSAGHITKVVIGAAVVIIGFIYFVRFLEGAYSI